MTSTRPANHLGVTAGGNSGRSAAQSSIRAAQVRSPLNTDRAGLVRQRKWLDAPKGPALYVAIQSAAETALPPLHEELLECHLIYANRKRCGGLLLVVHLSDVMTCQLIGDVIERRPHVGHRISHGCRQVGWDRPIESEPVCPPIAHRPEARGRRHS